MNKSSLITLLGSIAIGATSKKFGAKNRANRTISCLGVPWRKDVPLWHGTTAFQKIMSQNRIKSRKQLVEGQVTQAVGGGTNLSVSMTSDYRVAAAVAVGLNVIRRIANDEITATELFEFANKELMPAVESDSKNREWILRRNVTEGYMDRRIVDAIDSGCLLTVCSPWGYLNDLPDGKDLEIRSKIERLSSKILGSYVLQPGVKPLSQVHEFVNNGVPCKYARNVAFAPELFAHDPHLLAYQKAQKRQLCFSMYKTIISAGSAVRRFYDPLFFGTNIEAFVGLHKEDIGIVCATSDIPYVCFAPSAYADYGYLSKETVRYWDEILDEMYYSTTDCVEGSMYASCFSMHSRGNFKVGDYTWEHHDINPNCDTTMMGLSSMSEIRVYAPSMLNIIPEGSYVDINWGAFSERDTTNKIANIRWGEEYLEDMIAFDYFEDNDPSVLQRFNLGVSK